ncbi:ABC transporter permease [Duganella sp. sic0402]|uniref:ABC transporter permease n=1 Tax=Duganella sp. sic0402 TaxID=2854786 RepID=UPI001C47738B|nr:ABC transporter permease [Duganella sp. sic0402]MBV7536268.1 ABC transporter permease [Duganella sp. sic0402]
MSAGLWSLAWRRLRADWLAMASLAVVAVFLLLALLSASGLIVADWDAEVGISYAPPKFAAGVAGSTPPAAAAPAPAASAPPRDLPANPFDPLAEDIRALRAVVSAETAVRLPALPFGGDKWGHDVIKKTIKGGATSIAVGLVAALLAVSLGTLLGALSGYWGGVADDFLNWCYSVFTAIPSVLMILAVAAVLQQKGVLSIVLILGLTGWTGPYRLIRAEYIKHKAREYVLAADAIGASHWRRMFSHIFPNVSHVALVQLSILAVGFIKAEVILTFLGFGVPAGVVSWGSMLNEAQGELLLGRWWQLAAAAGAMALLVTAFSLFTDALRDALDPKVKQ